MQPLLTAVNDTYFKRILGYHNVRYQSVGALHKFDGFNDYNHLISINQVFSTFPKFDIIDRTGSVTLPLNYYIQRPWVVPTQKLTLADALKERVDNLLALKQKINIMWSGGIDSTATVTAFLKHTTDKQQLRILYSPFSTYEHPEYLTFLKKFPDVELVDISGTVYLDSQFDGIFINGHGGDEIMASLDESFFTEYGYERLFKSWQDFFYQLNPDNNFIEFCEKYFAQSGRPIDTLLEARWWFYAICKNDSLLHETKLPYFLNYNNFKWNQVQGFFDCNEFEKYIYWNIDTVLSSNKYNSWKQILKDYCYEFDGQLDWAENKEKVGSSQFSLYTSKKLILNNQRWLMLLSDNTCISTPNLPLLSEKEYRSTYGNRLDYLFNDPN
jgi:hypothetical protein